MKDIEKIINNPWITKAILTVLTIIISIIIYKLIIKFIVKAIDIDQKTESDRKKATYVKLSKSICRYIFILITLLFILQIFGINISSVIAGVGLLGVIFGLALQDFLKDIIRGSTILSDNYFKVGDVVKYKGMEGKVLILGLKSTKIQDLKTGNIVSISNRNIEEIEIASTFTYVRVPMPYEVKIDKAEKAIGDIIELIKENEKVIECNYKGVAELADSSIKYLLEIKCNPVVKLQINRDALRCVIIGLEKNNIKVPFNQFDVHQK